MTNIDSSPSQPLYKDVSAPVSSQVKDLLARMTLEEKIGQITQVEKNSIDPEAVKRHGIGSILSGGGGNPADNSPAGWQEMVGGFLEAARQTRLGIPLIYGVDGVHGHSNVVGATIFPHNIGLGAARDAALVQRIGRATALELSATGVFWNFAPCVAVPRDVRWGRTYEGFSENTQLVTELGAAYLTGLQGDDLSAAGSVLACPKHFIADGGTSWGSTPRYDWLDNYWQAVDERYMIDQGDARMDEVELYQTHLPPYLKAIEAGARTIMISFSSWNGAKLHAHHHLLTEVLKGQFGFSGFLVSDWQAINQLSADYHECVVASINAGLDMIMVPFEYQRFIDTLTEAVQSGDVPLERIDDAVRRILTAKYELGLFQNNIEDEPKIDIVGSDEHRQLAREAVRKSLVLLKNDGSTLPIAKNTAQIIIAGAAADSIGLQCGGWTIEWLGGTDKITQGTTLLQAIRQTVSAETTIHFEKSGRFPESIEAEVGIVCLHEPPYAEGVGDRADLRLNNEEIGLLERVRARCRRLVVIIFSGRPLIITKQLPVADAWIAAWLPGTEGQGLADVLFGDVPFGGKLPYTWPRDMDQIPLGNIGEDDPLFPLGFGLS
ncbi:MAG TPA: glycoside hydrolase family 3 N-terminal domain-containing protein [Anaerolineae bacterium]|jgi:beta-glucosidase|nr:glycoside hydrolase family 3 N-terminal domain-containing protein [Anaerolineae bacterium]